MEKTPEDVLQQELLRERAEVLGRAGNSVEKALMKLHNLEAAIKERCQTLHQLEERHPDRGVCDLPTKKKQIIKEINKEISHYNTLREHARLRYYYLIVTREALGLRKHHRVEEMFPIPPKKRPLQEN